jgi:hypothetical protein
MALTSVKCSEIHFQKGSQYIAMGRNELNTLYEHWLTDDCFKRFFKYGYTYNVDTCFMFEKGFPVEI